MTINYEELKKQNKTINIITISSLVGNAVLIGIIVGLVFFVNYSIFEDASQPKLTILNDYISVRDIDGVQYLEFGLYSPNENTIDISLKSPNLIHTVLHEYGHYVWFKKMSKSMRLEWKYSCNMTELKDKGRYVNYNDDRVCLEYFADQFAYVLVGTDDGVFISEMIEEYVD